LIYYAGKTEMTDTDISLCMVPDMVPESENKLSINGLLEKITAVSRGHILIILECKRDKCSNNLKLPPECILIYSASPDQGIK